MKKLTALALALTLALSLTACGKTDAPKTPAGSTPSSNASSSVDTKPAAKWASKVDVQLPASAGGGTDVVARALTQHISENTDSNLTIINNNDGGGVVAYETARTGKADGSTILVFHSTMCIKYATGIYDKNPAEDFTVIGYSDPDEKGGYILVVPGDGDIKTLDDFVAAAKDAPGEMLFGVETGGSSHIMAGLFSQAADIDMKFVEAGPDTEKLTALVGGSINACMVNPNQAKQYVESGKVIALAGVSTDEAGSRGSVLPDVPSFIEQGVNFTYGTNFIILGPKDMDEDLAKEINAAFAAATQDPETNELLTKAGMSMVWRSYEDSQPGLAAQQETLSAIVESLGLKQN